jgi:hypothetical protein
MSSWSLRTLNVSRTSIKIQDKTQTLTRQTRRRSTNVMNAIANMTHRPSTVNLTATAQKEDTGPGPQQDFQNGEAYNATERWYKEHPSQQPWNGLSTGGIGDRK